MLLRGPTGRIARRQRHPTQTARAAHSGQALVIFAFFSFVLIGALALAVDGGFILAERRQVQTAADAAALAASKAIVDNRPDLANASAQAYAQANAGAGATVQILRPPTSGAYAGDNRYIQIVVQQDVQKYFVGAIYSGPWRVSASATAGVETELGDYALITLNRNSAPGIYLNGNTGIAISGGRASAMSNTSIHSNGVTNFTTPGTIDAHTTVTVGGGTWNAPDRIRRNQPQIDDPLASMTHPQSPATLRTFAADCPGNVCQPGLYRNENVTLSGTYTFSPGLYYFENTDLALQNSSATINGSEVLFYFDSDSTFDPKNGNVSLTSSPSSLYTGMQPELVFWYDSCATLDMQGNGNLYFSGIFYAPCALVQMHGNPGSDTVNGQLIVNRLDVRGTSDLRIAYRALTETQRPRVYLVE